LSPLGLEGFQVDQVGGGWSLLSEAGESQKLAQGTIRLESTQIRDGSVMAKWEVGLGPNSRAISWWLRQRTLK
jgi:hypothetical protein